MAQNYEINPTTRCLTPGGGLNCRPLPLRLAAACCGIPAPVGSPMGSLALSPGSDQSFFACSDTFQFTATALDLQGLPLADVQVVFGFPPIVGGTHPITGSFTPFSGITDANGEVSSNLSLDLATCAANCANTLDCSATVEARDLSGAIHSNTVLLVDQVQ